MNGLALDRLVAGRGAFRLAPLTLQAESGVRVALLGPNGGGKTTLLKTIAGLLRPLAGRVRIDEVELQGASGDVRARLIAYLPPPGEVDAPFSARHVVALGRLARRRWPGDLRHADGEAAQAALETLGAADLADRRFDLLSSGQRQLVLIARTLAQDARVCLLDEPSATLDPAHRAAVFGAVDALAEAGKVVLFSTHEPQEARRSDLCVAVGRGIEVGPPDALLTVERLTSLYGRELPPWMTGPGSL